MFFRNKVVRVDHDKLTRYCLVVSAAVAKMVEQFARLEPAEQREALSEVLKIAGRLDYPPLTDDDLTTIAGQTFALLDQEENDAATR